MAKYPLDKAHYNQAIKFARLTGIDDVVHGGIRGDELIAKIQLVHGPITEFELPDGDVENGPSAMEALPVVDHTQAVTSDHYRHDPTVTVMIQTDEENGGHHPVPVCVNGDHILIQRNEEVPIPFRFYEALKIAVETNYRQEPPPQGGKPITVSERRHAFRFSTTDMPSKDEIAAYRKRVANIGRDKAVDAALAPVPAPAAQLSPEAHAFIEAMSGAFLAKQAA